MRKDIPELLAPAGDRERLETALLYGADAVYLAGKGFGLRAACGNFDEEGLREAVRLADGQGARVYVACNFLPRFEEIRRLPAFLELVQDAGADAVIAADLGVMGLVKRHAPRCALHASTQLGVVNEETARVLYEHGVARVVLARELSLEEIEEIRARTPAALELEAFVHGAMCMAYSGRCMLSAYLTGRDANRGDCAQPCRWRFRIREAGRPGPEWSAEAGEDGAYLFNAMDLCMVEHIAALDRAGIGSFKIEGRAKAAYYTAAAVNAYRAAMDGYVAAGCPADYVVPAWIREELDKISHRPYGTGFYFGPPEQATDSGGYIQHYEVAAVTEGWKEGRLLVSQRNRFAAGDRLEILEPGRPPIPLIAAELLDGEGHPITTAPHPTMKLSLACPHPVTPGVMLRRKK